MRTAEEAQKNGHEIGVFNYKTFVKGGHAVVNGFKMYYEVHGTGPRTPLVTIPQIWQPASVLPSGLKTSAPTTPGGALNDVISVPRFTSCKTTDPSDDAEAII